MRNLLATATGCCCLAILASHYCALGSISSTAVFMETEVNFKYTEQQLEDSSASFCKTFADNNSETNSSASTMLLANSSLDLLLEEEDNGCSNNSPPSSTPASFFRAAIAWYSQSLEERPVLTKSTTASLMGAVGDIVAQLVETSLEESSGSIRLDVRRTLSLAVEGFVISGPFMHFGYDLLEAYLPVFQDDNNYDNNNNNSTYSSWFMVVCQVLVDALFMDSIMVATAIMTTSFLEGSNTTTNNNNKSSSNKNAFRTILQDLKVSYLPACKASWISSVFWSPVQLLSFKYVPLPFRVAAVNLQDIAWFATISYMSHRCRKKQHQNGDE